MFCEIEWSSHSPIAWLDSGMRCCRLDQIFLFRRACGALTRMTALACRPLPSFGSASGASERCLHVVCRPGRRRTMAFSAANSSLMSIVQMRARHSLICKVDCMNLILFVPYSSVRVEANTEVVKFLWRVWYMSLHGMPPPWLRKKCYGDSSAAP